MGPILGSSTFARFSPAKSALTVVGNSISDPALPSDLWAQVAAMSPLNGQMTIHNRSHSGASIQNLAGVGSEADSSYEAGKTNYLFFWELTNDIQNAGRTGPQTIADAVSYIQARQTYVATHLPGEKPWRVILMTGLPRGDNYYAFTGPQGEIEMEYCNTYIRQNYKAMGAIGFVEARQPGGPFNFTDVTNAANFPSALWRDKTHPTNGATGGMGILAQYIAAALRRLPAR